MEKKKERIKQNRRDEHSTVSNDAIFLLSSLFVEFLLLLKSWITERAKKQVPMRRIHWPHIRLYICIGSDSPIQDSDQQRMSERERERLIIFTYWHTNDIDVACFSFHRWNVSGWWDERRLHNRARLDSILFVCSIFLVHFFHVSLGYARMLFLGHVICFACTILCVCM